MRALVAGLLLLLASFSASPQQPDAENARRTIAAIEELLKQRPADANLWFFLARFRAALDDRPGTVAALEKVLETGDGFLPPRDSFEKVWDHAPFQAVRERMEAKLPRLDFAPTAFELDERTLVPEGIAYDRPSRSFFVGSIRGRVLRVVPGGDVTEFAGFRADLDAILGIAVDSPRRIVYVVSTSALTEVGEKNRRNTVVAFDIDSGRLLNRYEVADAQQLNDVAVAPGGRVFATDSASGAVYEIAVKGPGPTRPLVPANQIRGSNGLAPSPDGKRLYVAHSTGIAVVDVASGQWKRLTNDTRETVAAIDGLYQYQGELIGVQNITTPGRVIRIALAPDGERITHVTTLLSHHHTALYEPTTLAVSDRGLFLLAATGVSHFNRAGTVDRPESIPLPTVVRIPLPR